MSSFEEGLSKVKEIEKLFRLGNWPNANKKLRKLTRDQSSSGQDAAGLILRASAVSKLDYMLDDEDITLPTAVKTAFAALQRGHSATAAQMRKLEEKMLEKNRQTDVKCDALGNRLAYLEACFDEWSASNHNNMGAAPLLLEGQKPRALEAQNGRPVVDSAITTPTITRESQGEAPLNEEEETAVAWRELSEGDAKSGFNLLLGIVDEPTPPASETQGDQVSVAAASKIAIVGEAPDTSLPFIPQGARALLGGFSPPPPGGPLGCALVEENEEVPVGVPAAAQPEGSIEVRQPEGAAKEAGKVATNDLPLLEFSAAVECAASSGQGREGLFMAKPDGREGAPGTTMSLELEGSSPTSSSEPQLNPSPPPPVAAAIPPPANALDEAHDGAQKESEDPAPMTRVALVEKQELPARAIVQYLQPVGVSNEKVIEGDVPLQESSTASCVLFPSQEGHVPSKTDTAAKDPKIRAASKFKSRKKQKQKQRNGLR